MKVFAPAKINLYLKILGKRPDHFHELETLMCPLHLADVLEFEERESGVELEIEGAQLSVGPDNLVCRAAAGLQEKSGVTKGAKILLRKKIPAGGGMGGGSSDAAHTLLALNKLWNCNLSLHQLGEIAATMGSDINFFLQPKPAVCKGRGEIIEPIPINNLPWVILINPGFGVPTPWAYKTYAGMNSPHGEPGRTFRWGAHSITLQNDLEPPVFSKYFWIAEAKQWLKRHPSTLDSMMSGSGATIFALVENQESGEQLVRDATKHFGEAVWIRLTRLLADASLITE